MLNHTMPMEDDAILAEQLSAVASQTRLRVLRLIQHGALRCRRSRCGLSEHCCNVTELATALRISAPTASHHLKELRRAGLIRMERQGRFINVSLRGEAIQQLAAALAGLTQHGNTLEAPHDG